MASTRLARKAIAIIGGDKRQNYMAELFSQLGYPVLVLGFTPLHPSSRLHICSNLNEALAGSDWVLCPIPFKKNLGVSIGELLESLVPGQTLAGGCIPDEVLDYCREQGISCYDMMKSEPVAIFNSIATAEGAIAEALIHHPANLHGEKALILGYGRCAKTLADKLKGLSVRVTVCARSGESLALAGALGVDVMEFSKLKTGIHSFQYIFNTIPAMVLDATAISRIHPDTVIIDIASAPGGVDFDAANAAGIDAGLYPGLPGIYAPLASARALVTDLIAHF